MDKQTVNTLSVASSNNFSTYSKKEKVLVLGSLGQIGSELVDVLRTKFGNENVIASDVRLPQDLGFLEKGPFAFCDATNYNQIRNLVKNNQITWLIHNAAFLSAIAERNVEAACKLNTEGVHNVLSIAKEFGCRVMIPSSIAAFGPSTPLHDTPQITIQRPTGIYGIGKVYAELMGEYYNKNHGVDFRSLRYPGIISWKTLPGGGTTDYAIEIFHSALKGEKYKCFLSPDVRLPMMYMHDCLKCTVDLMCAENEKLKHRTYNITSFNITPNELYLAIKKYIPSFEIEYVVDPLREGFAQSWPKSIDDSAAREDWGWKEDFGLDEMVKDMLQNLSRHVIKDAKFKF
jgi:threonine 3-dehydrogenase